MRIAYLNTRSDAIGGAAVHIRDLSSALLAQGHEVTVILGGEGAGTKDLAERGIPYHSLQHLIRPINPMQDFLAILEIRKILKELQPNLLSVHSSKAGWLGRIAASSAGIPVIFTAHGWAFPGREQKVAWIYRWAEKFAAPFANRIITVSENDRQLALRYRIAADNKLIRVHNGMPDISTSLQAQPAHQPPRLIMVARFQEPKDHATLLQALALIKDKEWSLSLVGDGELQAECEKLAEGLGISKRVHFLGARDDVAEQLAQSQIFLLLSKWEGFPRSILEAMRAALPVIASNVGGIKEAVVEGESGYLIPRGDVTALQSKLVNLLADPTLRVKMGKAGRQRYETHFTFERMLEETIAVYREVLEQVGK